MKKERTKGFISGILVSALVFSLASTAAATIGQRTLNAAYSDIKIELNGKRITPTDANGNVVEPFAVNGTTYLPVRAIGNALGLNVTWDSKTNTAKLEGNTVSNSFDECYPDFSVPTLDNIVGTDAYVELYTLDSGDSIVYYYDPGKFNIPTGSNYVDAYEALLENYGFNYLKADDGLYYDNPTSGTTLVLYVDQSTKYVCVLVMALPDSNRKTLLSTATSYSGGGAGNTTSPSVDSSTGLSGVYAFPLHLYSNDGKTYLGKLVTSPYDSDGIWNTYGTYGSKYNAESIWNTYGTYGSKYSSESAFNEYASSPPKIVDNGGKFVGYLTANTFTVDGYTIEEISRFLNNKNQ